MKQWEAAYRRAEALGVRFLREKVVKVKRVGGEFLINDRFKADRVVSTLPLNEASQIFSLPEEAFKVAQRLDYNSVVVVGVGLRRDTPQRHWIYVPDKRYPFHRYAWISNYGEDAPPGRSALIAEITVQRGQKVDFEGLKHEVVQGLVELGELREGEVDVVTGWLHEYGYPIYTLSHSSDVAILERFLREMGVVPFGRWGIWQYWNTDRIFEEVQKLIF